MATRVVTDSTSDLTPELAEELGVAVVPLNVMPGAGTYKHDVDVTADELCGRLQTGDVRDVRSEGTEPLVTRSGPVIGTCAGLGAVIVGVPEVGE